MDVDYGHPRMEIATIFERFLVLFLRWKSLKLLEKVTVGSLANTAPIRLTKKQIMSAKKKAR